MEKKHPLSVFSWYFTRGYALRHPVRVLKWFLDARHQARDRAVYGWCRNDTNDWYNWVAHALCGLLRDIADTEWVRPKRAAEIRVIADNIAYAILDASETEAADAEFFRVENDPAATEEEKAAALNINTEKRRAITEAHHKMLADAFARLGNIFFDFMR